MLDLQSVLATNDLKVRNVELSKGELEDLQWAFEFTYESVDMMAYQRKHEERVILETGVEVPKQVKKLFEELPIASFGLKKALYTFPFTLSVIKDVKDKMKFVFQGKIYADATGHDAMQLVMLMKNAVLFTSLSLGEVEAAAKEFEKRKEKAEKILVTPEADGNLIK